MWLSQETGATERTTGKCWHYHVTTEICADWNANWVLCLEADIGVRERGGGGGGGGVGVSPSLDTTFI